MNSRRPFRHSETPREDNQMIYGLRPVMEALEAGKEIERIFLGRTARGPLMMELRKALKERGIVWQEVPTEKLNKFTRSNHQDVVCFISPVIYHSLAGLIPALYEKGLVPLILVLDRITDVRNFGAIARTAECAGVHAIVIPAKNAAQVSADAIRTSAGALNTLPVCRENNLKSAIRFLQESGLKAVAATEKASGFHHEAELSVPLAIIMGSEEDGISDELIKVSDVLVRIPMHGKVSSLNVSVAAGVMIYEALRQRSLNSD